MLCEAYDKRSEWRLARVDKLMALGVAWGLYCSVSEGDVGIVRRFDDMLHGMCAEEVLIDGNRYFVTEDNEEKGSIVWDAFLLHIDLLYDEGEKLPQVTFDISDRHQWLACDVMSRAYEEEEELKGVERVEEVEEVERVEGVEEVESCQSNTMGECVCRYVQPVSHVAFPPEFINFLLYNKQMQKLMNEEKKEYYQNKYNIHYDKDANCVVLNDVQFHEEVTLCAGNARDLLKDMEKSKAEKKAAENTVGDEELCHFIYPGLDEKEGLKVHRQVKDLVKRFAMKDICCFLQSLADEKKVLLPQIPQNAFDELHRMGMPGIDAKGFSYDNFCKCYRK